MGGRASPSGEGSVDAGGEIGAVDGIERRGGGTGFMGTGGGGGLCEPKDRTDDTNGVEGALALPTARPRWTSSFERLSFDIMRCSRLLLADLVVGVRDTVLTVAAAAG